MRGGRSEKQVRGLRCKFGGVPLMQVDWHFLATPGLPLRISCLCHSNPCRDRLLGEALAKLCGSS